MRRQALVEFKKVSANEKSLPILTLYYRDKLARRLVLSLEDQIEKHREMTIEILTTFVERVGLKEEAQILLPAVANRMNKLPFIETCKHSLAFAISSLHIFSTRRCCSNVWSFTAEEVRMLLIELLEACLEADKFQFLAQMGPVCGMLARALSDENPEMKQKCASFAAALCRELPEKVGAYMKNTVDAMCVNLGHQHKNVRKVTLRGFKDVLVARNAELFLQDCIKQLKFTSNDRSADVRRTFYEVLQFWMTRMDISALKLFEGDFVLLLLNGVADD